MVNRALRSVDSGGGLSEFALNSGIIPVPRLFNREGRCKPRRMSSRVRTQSSAQQASPT